MELRQLEYFVAVAEERGFTKAALRVHVAQPGVSAQIKQLERELGEPLFDRSGRAVHLTQAGTAALGHARAALATVAQLRAAVSEVSGLIRGRVAIGTITAAGGLDFAELLAGFHRRYPGVEISLTEDNSDVLLAKVRAGEVDLAWIGRSSSTALPTGLASQIVTDEELVAVVALDHRLAQRRRIRLVELAEEALVCLPAGTGIRGALDAAAADDGFRARVQFEATAPLASIDLASKGLGVGVVPLSAAEYASEPFRTVRIAGPQLRSRLELAWRVDAAGLVAGGPATRALVGHARRFVAEHQAGRTDAPPCTTRRRVAG